MTGEDLKPVEDDTKQMDDDQASADQETSVDTDPVRWSESETRGTLPETDLTTVLHIDVLFCKMMMVIRGRFLH